jgi:DNA-binding MarR family transcriptional regulator
VVKRVSESGLLEGADAPRGERRRTVYAITEAGEAALRDWLRQPPRTYEMRDEGLLKLFFAGALPREEAVEIVRAMRRRHADLVERLRAIEPKALEKEDPYPLLVLRGGIEFNEWFGGWCERLEAQLLESVPQERSQ